MIHAQQCRAVNEVLRAIESGVSASIESGEPLRAVSR